MNKILRRWGAVLLLWLCFSSCAAAATVQVAGQGATEAAALRDAMRQAIEKQVGVYVDSRTYTENYQVINDRIYTQAEGYIQSFEVISKRQVAGIWQIAINADVRSEQLRADLMSRLQKKALIGINMADPRIGVLAVDTEGNESEYLENILINGLHNEGFSRLIDLNQIDASVKMRIKSATWEGDTELLRMLSSQFNIDYLVKATISQSGRDFNPVIPINDPNIGITGLPLGDLIPDLQNLNHAEVTLSVRMLNMNTGEIIYAGSESGKGGGSNAAGKALSKATNNILKALSQAAIQKAANPEQHITVLITGGALGMMSQAYQRLSELPGVSHVFTRSSSNGNIQVDVDYIGTAYDLAAVMESSGIVIKEMNSEYIKI